MLRRFAGWALLVMGASGFIPLFDKAHPAKDPVIVAVLTCMLLISGVLVLRKKSAVAAPSLDARVLEVVRARHGRVTIAAVADDADISVAEAMKVLHAMRARGLCHQADDDFVFDEFADASSKRRVMVGDGQ